VTDIDPKYWKRSAKHLRIVGRFPSQGEEMLDLPGDTAFLLAALPPSRRQQRLALAVVGGLIVIVAAAYPFEAIALPFFVLPLAIMQTLIMAADVIIAVLLYSQFAILGWRSLLWLAGSYLYAALVGVVHFVSYPGVLSPKAALGLQTTGWLFVAWHCALPIAVIAYVLRQGEDHDAGRTDQPTHSAIALNASTMVAMACAAVCAALIADRYLPPFFLDDVHLAPLGRAIEAAMALAFVGALAALWLRRRSVLELWLMVILAVWLIAIVYAGVFVGERFTVAFYVARAYWLITALLILLVLLSESTTLYARLAYSIVLSRRQRIAQAVTVDAMSASFAHELSQPVAAMVANGEAALLWLNKAPPDLGKARNSLEQVAGDGRRASEAIASVRAMFQEGAARKELVDINAVIREALTIETKSLRDAAVLVDLDFAEGLPQVLAEPAQLQQVILNLIVNAVEAMNLVTDRPRALRIQTRTSQSHDLSIVVADSGGGLGPDALRLFDPFFTTKAQGIGLGLWICRRIVELHDGRLTAAPGVEHGSIFTITLPGLPPAISLTPSP
jgi:signal transduction histidine kinase